MNKSTHIKKVKSCDYLRVFKKISYPQSPLGSIRVVFAVFVNSEV